MRRIFFAILAIMTFPFASWAADSDFNGWGVRASLDVSMPGKWEIPGQDPMKMFSAGAGVSAGMVYNAPFAGNFYLEPGLNLFYDTYQMSDITVSVEGDATQLTTSPSVKKFGARIPLMFGYRVFLPSDFSLAIYTGPELSYCFTARAGYDKDIPELSNMETDLFKSGMRRYDCGWKVGLGAPMGRWVVALDYYFGFIDQNKLAPSYRERRLSLSVGYDF